MHLYRDAIQKLNNESADFAQRKGIIFDSWKDSMAQDIDVADIYLIRSSMMTSSNGNIFRVTGYLCGKFTGPRWIPLTKASDAELWGFLWSAPE